MSTMAADSGLTIAVGDDEPSARYQKLSQAIMHEWIQLSSSTLPNFTKLTQLLLVLACLLALLVLQMRATCIQWKDRCMAEKARADAAELEIARLKESLKVSHWGWDILTQWPLSTACCTAVESKMLLTFEPHFDGS